MTTATAIDLAGIDLASTAVIADLYLRLSDLRSEAQLLGREALLRAEAERLGWTVHRVITENDMTPGASRSASAFKRRKITLPNGKVGLRTVRDGFRSMLEDIADGTVTAILAEDLDRLLRQPRDGEDLLDAVEMAGATVRSLSGSVTLTEGGTPDERFMARIMANVASKSSADMSRRITAAKARLAGKSYTGYRPYGYRRDPDSKEYARNLLIDEAEAEVIKQAADDILDRDISLRSIARSLNDRGVPSATGRKWSAAALRTTLLKPTNAGLAWDPATPCTTRRAFSIFLTGNQIAEYSW
jgi:site-specific DNA recombinase